MDRLFRNLDALDQFDQESDDDDNDYMVCERRQYKMTPRINLGQWDEADFVYRFRLSKQTVMIVHEAIQHKLLFSRERYVIVYMNE